MTGIFWVLRSGSPWADVPERYGPPTTVYNRFNRWRKAGVWDRLMDAIIFYRARFVVGTYNEADASLFRVKHGLSYWPNVLRDCMSSARKLFR
jgi:transposase